MFSTADSHNLLKSARNPPDVGCPFFFQHEKDRDQSAAHGMNLPPVHGQTDSGL